MQRLLTLARTSVSTTMSSCVNIKKLVSQTGVQFNGDEFCIDAPDSVFLVAGQNLTMKQIPYGEEITHSFGGAFGQYLLKGKSQILHFYEIQVNKSETIYLNTISNWNGSLPSMLSNEEIEKTVANILFM